MSIIAIMLVAGILLCWFFVRNAIPRARKAKLKNRNHNSRVLPRKDK